MDAWSPFFSSDHFMPHGHCYLWEPGLLSLHIISDALIAAAYFSIPFTLLYFIRRRTDLVFRWIYLCFAVFIVACGFTHLMEIWVVWNPAYWWSGGIKAVTAAASVSTAVMLVKLVPDALSLPGPALLRQANHALAEEVSIRMSAEAEVRLLNGQLAQRVSDRVSELEEVNRRLEVEMAERRRGDEARARLAAIIESSDDAIISKTLEGIITSWNPAAERIFGYSAAESIGRPIMMLVPPEREDEEHAILRRITRGEKVEHFETIRVAKDGRKIEISVTISAVRDADDRIVGISKIARDISARRGAETKLRESEERFSTVFHHTQVAMTLSRLSDGVMVQANEEWARLSGFSLSEALGRSVVDLGFVKPETGEENRAELRSSGVVAPAESRVRARGGEERIVLASRKVVQIGGEPHVLASMHDITERKQAEVALRRSREEFKDLFDNAPIGYHEVGPDGRLVRINQAELKMLGYSAGELLGQFVWKIGADEQLSRDAVLGKLAGNPPPAAFERELRRKDGSVFPVMIEDRIVRNEAGKIAGIRAIVQDITDRRTAEESIHRMNEDLERRVRERTAQLEDANREMEAFSYSVSHDLRAPLRAVDGFSQAALEDYGPTLPPEGRHQLTTIRESAQRMGELIDDLLAFSRLSRQTLRKRSVDTDALVRTVLAELLERTAGRRIETKLGELPACEGDPALLRQAWINLISNALKYTRRRDVSTVEIGCFEKEGQDVYFVRDNGTGFDMRYANKLFGVFQRLHRAEEYEGTGVGLAIVHRVVQRHGGRVWAEAAPDRGATFFFTLEPETKT